MNELSNTDLKSLMEVAASEQLEDQRRGVIGFIKSKLQARDFAQERVDALEKELSAARGRLAAAESDINKIASGDWSVIKLANDKKKKDDED